MLQETHSVKLTYPMPQVAVRSAPDTFPPQTGTELLPLLRIKILPPLIPAQQRLQAIKGIVVL
jgi:hypothetical protein